MINFFRGLFIGLEEKIKRAEEQIAALAPHEITGETAENDRVLNPEAGRQIMKLINDIRKWRRNLPSRDRAYDRNFEVGDECHFYDSQGNAGICVVIRKYEEDSLNRVMVLFKGNEYGLFSYMYESDNYIKFKPALAAEDIFVTMHFLASGKTSIDSDQVLYKRPRVSAYVMVMILFLAGCREPVLKNTRDYAILDVEKTFYSESLHGPVYQYRIDGCQYIGRLNASNNFLTHKQNCDNHGTHQD